ncbi:NEDD8-conjugating enzyme Ubc12-like isoform X1 [Rhododendron vialii]|uniref:NEDD8-conjugating enzyme Ubc12-like isoform X1 n=1 Tax=Rhododendron vialii TaxID=182163 RepID=UPI0026600F79|nr:NEDD8-conjugating enzyme Ubc12-like isoform X1 [Rhododendron vialii]
MGLSLSLSLSLSCESIIISRNQQKDGETSSIQSLCSSAVFPRAGIMIRLFKVKEKHRELAENGKTAIKKQSAGELRLHKDISELNLPKTCSISFPNGKDDLMNFQVTIRPREGYYRGGLFLFSFKVSPIYPHEAPKVKCKTKVYHPNIDMEGNVCLNVLREDWKPVLNINTIVYGLYHLFTEPNHEDPLNSEAAEVLRDNPKMYESNVKKAMAGGGYVGNNNYFP